MPRHVLLVDAKAQPDWISGLRDAVHGIAHITAVDSLHAALKMLRAATPDVLVTNVRLGAYNGIQLVLRAAPAGIRCVVYAEEHDIVLAREAQEAGALYIRLADLRASFRSLMDGELPARDRRNPAIIDRRRTRRGGRRTYDRPT
jgi:DNA-binding NarL/FixJ family response regulator